MEVVTMAGRGSSGEVRELPAGCARVCGAAAPGPRRVVSRTVQAERDAGAPVRVDVVVGDVGGAAGGDDDAGAVVAVHEVRRQRGGSAHLEREGRREG